MPKPGDKERAPINWAAPEREVLRRLRWYRMGVPPGTVVTETDELPDRLDREDREAASARNLRLCRLLPKR